MTFFGRGLAEYPLERLPFGWYLNWTFKESPERPGGIEFVQTVPVDEDYPPDWEEVRLAALANKGALWQIGNEPECIHQGQLTPEEYTEIYHAYYVFLKGVDPGAQIAIGAVVQPTPLRLEWLDRVLRHYAVHYGGPMPVDVWNIHNLILREDRDGYGTGIPVGLVAERGMEYPWWENDNVDYFVDHIWAFRRWMADNGYRNRPLIVSEFGVVYSSTWFDVLGDPGGDARVMAFMEETFDFMLRTTDPDLGYPADGNRLVQRWAWLSLNSRQFHEDPIHGYNGSLCDPDTKELRVFGEHYERLLAGYLAEQP